MRVKYLGPRDQVFVAPYGRHWKDEIKEYPDEFAEELLATSKRQRFEIVDTGKVKKEAEPESVAPPKIHIVDPLLNAARSAIDAGKVTRDGKPLVEAMEEILGRDISAAERDRVWEKLQRHKA